MHLISHRGNISGPKPDLENTLEHIDAALRKGYDVEIDVWWQDGKFFLGHDEPLYEVPIKYLKNDKFWCHCKSITTLNQLLINDIHCFFHDKDDATLTSKNFIWTFPKKDLVKNSICVLPELGHSKNIFSCAGICSDYIEEYHEKS